MQAMIAPRAADTVVAVHLYLSPLLNTHMPARPLFTWRSAAGAGSGCCDALGMLAARARIVSLSASSTC
jgi:hypothetical protein